MSANRVPLGGTMATFPRTESEITALARQVTAGLAEHAERFPAPTVPVAELRAAYDAFIAAMLSAQDAEAAAKLRYAEKAKALATLVDCLKSDLRYAENTTRDDNELVKLGWGGRRPRTKLGVPGQAMGLQIVEEGAGSIALRWKKPVGGGAVAAYKVQVARPEDGVCEDVGRLLRESTVAAWAYGLLYRPEFASWPYAVKSSTLLLGPCGVA